MGMHNLHYEKFADGTVKCIEDEIPMELPDGWAWCRLNVISAAQPNSFVDGPFGSNLKTEHYTNNREVRIIQLNNIGEFVWKNNGVKYTTFKHSETLDRCITYPEDIVIAKMMPAGRAIIVPSIEAIYVISSDCVRLRVADIVFNKYIMFAINSSVVNEQIQESVHGIGRSRTSLSKCKELLIPIPPMHEQHAICDSIEIIFSLLTTIEATKSDLASTINIAKSKILDLAIRGKLVPQNPEDEPASVLLERIRAEKEELIRQGKIKRDKKESVIFKGEDNSYYEKIGETTIDITDEIPFEPIIAMEFVRYKSVLELVSGRDLLPSEYNDYGKGIPYITGASNFANGVINIVRWTHSPQVITCCGDLLITCKGTVGEMAFNSFGEAHIARQVMAIRNIHSLNIDYVSLCIKYHIEEIKTAAKGLIPGISREDILELIIPLPSEAYQTRVVTRVNEMFSFIDSIEKSLM